MILIVFYNSDYKYTNTLNHRAHTSKFTYSLQGNQESKGHFLNSRLLKDVDDKNIISCMAFIVIVTFCIFFIVKIR